mgnify:CR=1 FL=1
MNGALKAIRFVVCQPDKPLHVRIAVCCCSLLLLCFAWLPSSVFAVSQAYDSLNRLTSVVYSPTQRIDYVYDSAGNLIEERINGAAGLSVTTQANPAAGGSVSISPPQSSFVAGDVVTVTATPTAGYTFTGWSGVSGCSIASACTFTVGSTNIAAVANFVVPSTLQPLRVSAIPAVGGTVSPTPNAAGYAAGTALSFTATPALGYAVKNWYGAACAGVGGATCGFNMPARASDVYVTFTQPGSGYALSYDYGALANSPTTDPRRAGVVEFLPSADLVPAGTPVTFRMLPAAGFRVRTLRFSVNGVADATICPSVQAFFFFPGEIATCTFPMPAGNVNLTAYFDTDLDRYVLDASVSPVSGGVVGLTTTPDQNFENMYISSRPLRSMVAGGVSTTLNAIPAGARQFLSWQNGPCANSTNPVCTFTMPTSAVVSNALFSDAPDPSCTYAVAAPSLAFPGSGGSRAITLATQAGCGYSATVYDDSSSGTVVSSVSGSTVTLTLPVFASNFGRMGVLRIFAGKEVISLPFVQAGNSTTSQTNGTAVDFGSVGAGDLGTVTRTVAITNPTATALNVSSITTRGPFAIRSNTCSSPLAVGASCSAIIEFVPKKAGSVIGEYLVATNNHVFATPLTGTVLATRENVAAATAGGSIVATTRWDPVVFPDAALIDGDRRQTPVDQTTWTNGDATNPQYLEVKFASVRAVEWLYLFGQYKDNPNYAEPSTISTESVSPLTGFSIQYWTGTTWAAVSELSRVDGTNVWRRVSFTPVTTDRVRVVLPTITNSRQMMASELEVWTVASDTTPNAFTFAPLLGALLSTAVQSGAITPIGFNAAAPISVSGGSYSIGCNGVFTTTAGTLQPVQSVCVRHTSAASGASTVTTTLTIGGVAGTFSSTTQTVIVPPSDVTPDPIASQTIIDVAVTSTIYFAPFSVTGINAPATLTISGTAGLEVSVGCTVAFTTTPTTVTNGQSICVRHVSANAALTNAVSTLTIGTVTVTFTSRTVAAALTCSFDFTGNGSVASDDALIFTRWLLGIRGDALISGITPYPAGTSPAQFAVSVANRMSIGLAHDLDGNGTVDALTDGLLLLRMSQGLMGTAVTANALGIGAVRGTHSLIGSYANTSCGTSFLLPAPPAVTSVSPLTGAKDTWTVVRVVGTDLPATVSLVVDGQNINPCNTSRPSSATSIDFWCPLKVIGAHTARVIVAFVAPAQQQQLGSTQSFIVYAPNIAITSFSPISRAGQFAFTVVGVDMPGTLGADIGGVTCGVSRVALATDGAFNCNVSTLPSGYHTVTVRDTSNSAILRQFTGAQGFLVP